MIWEDDIERLLFPSTEVLGLLFLFKPSGHVEARCLGQTGEL